MFDWLLSKLCKKKSCCTAPKNTTESVQATKTESRSDDKIVAPIEAVTPPTTVSEPSISTPEPVQPASQTDKIAVVVSENSCIPQDSMLRRHYLTNLRAMITSLSSSRPEDSALSRHYNTQIGAKVERCLTSDMAIQQLISDYAAYKKTLANSTAQAIPKIISEPVVETKETGAATQPEASKIPEDSMLRRHYLTNLASGNN